MWKIGERIFFTLRISYTRKQLCHLCHNCVKKTIGRISISMSIRSTLYLPVPLYLTPENPQKGVKSMIIHGVIFSHLWISAHKQIWLVLLATTTPSKTIELVLSPRRPYWKQLHLSTMECNTLKYHWNVAENLQHLPEFLSNRAIVYGRRHDVSMWWSRETSDERM